MASAEFARLNYENTGYDLLFGDRKKGVRRFHWYSLTLMKQPVYTSYAMEVIRKTPYRCRHHCYPYLGVELLLSGRLDYFFDGELRTLSAGSIALMHRNRDSGFDFNGKSEYRKLVVLLSGSALDPLCRSLKLEECSFFSLPDPNQALPYFREIFHLLNNQEPGTELRLSEKVYSLLLYLASLRNSDKEELYPNSLRRSLAFLARNFDKPLRIEEIAAAGGVSVSSIVRMFHGCLGTTPWRFLQKLRLDCAKELLRNSDLRIKEIALRSGFNDPLYFSTLFHRESGFSPREFREKSRSEYNIPDKGPAAEAERWPDNPLFRNESEMV